MRVCWRCGRREALALSRWPEEPAGGRRQEENKGSAIFGPTRLLPGLREQLRGVRACVEGLCVRYTASVCVRGDVVWVCATGRDSRPAVHRKSLLRQQNLRCPLHPLRVLGARGCSAGEDKPWYMVSRANVHNISGVLHPIYAFCYRVAGPKHPQGPRPILPASRPAPCRIHPSPPSLSPGAAASAPSPALRKATPHCGRAVFIRNKTQRAGLLWQVCSKYWLEHGGRLESSDYMLLPRETLPRLLQALPQPSKRCQ